MYIKSSQYRIWLIVTNRDILIPRPEAEWANEDLTIMKLNTKAATLTKHYESFTIKDGEFVDDMFGRLQVLLNNLEALEQTYSKAQINLKILDRFPKMWEPKTTSIQEARE
ncbi:hypothetical protein JHK82_055598 [Glycine max]|uniref:UBN2 domain-containing protein n=1 Tax=Glycine max TaxID=3847 RepID=A0A0R0E818_SOYBN|nr:hypothetical protein JHK86_055423 [Glycine max]KAG4918155.1 hypothetical protein JHK85_056436 [Glycine max]KAG5074232.1 hypothetical protein JHK84_055463 [Glycine max]KAG5076903.1 hypothetical protein JHK82_055598 [Glycine max]